METGPLLQILIFLLAMVISVPIAKRLGLGAVLGYLLIGVILGPSVLNLMGSGEDAHEVSHVAEFGVIMMLFMIGLELKPSLLWKLKNAIFILGTFQVVFTTAAVFGIALFFDFSWQMALAMGMMASLSSTAIVLQSLHEKNALKSTGGEVSFSILLFQDMAVIPMLALFPILAAKTSTSDTPGWLTALKILGAVVLVIFSGRYLIRPVFRAIAFAKLRELFTALALLIVVATAMLMHAVGLSPALGAFLAGVVLADSEYRHQLEIDIDPFKGILLAVFFISVGTNIEFAAIASQPGLVISGLLVLIFVKAIVLFGIAKMSKMSNLDSYLTAFSLAQGGEFAFVLLTLALTQGLLPAPTVQALTGSVALSMILAPLIIQAYFKWIEPCYMSRIDFRKPDPIEEKNSVIVAGFGRFGQPIVRLLKSAGYQPTVLDYDADQVDLLSSRLGMKAYFGDATSMDLLKSAGLANAKLLVVAIDDPDKILEIVENVKKEFPHVKIVSRSFDRIHAYKLIHLGIQTPFIETYGSALEMGVQALRELGVSDERAARTGASFKKYNDASIQKLALVYRDSDDATYMSQVRTTIDAIEKSMAEDQRMSP